MVEEHNTYQDMGKNFNRGRLHQGSSSSNRERAEMNIRVKKRAQTFEDQMLQNQIKDAFPSDMKKNPKDCMAVQLRNGKELEKEKS